MKSYINSSIGRLRLLGFLEGSSLLILVFLAMPLKHFFHWPYLTQCMGPIHGGLFLLFVINSFSVGADLHWKFQKTTYKLLLACMVPFGTFYIDRTLLKPAHELQKRNK